MDLIQVEITTTAHTHRYGTLATGDILRTDAPSTPERCRPSIWAL